MSVARRVAPEPARRGWCPSLARPMPTGDGLLARVHAPLGILTLAQARAVAEAARLHGNGHLDVTARANLQIRGVTEATALALATMLAAAGLGDVRDDGGPQRLTLTPPEAGLGSGALIDIPALARAIEAAGLCIAGLPAKTLVAIGSAAPPLLRSSEPFDGSARSEDVHTSCAPRSATALKSDAATEADIRLVATAPGMLAMALAGEEEPIWLGDVAAFDAPARVATILKAFAASEKRRMRDLSPAARQRMVETLGLRRCPAPAPAAALLPGLHPLRNGRVALVLDAPFGRCGADALDALTDAAERLRGVEIRLSPTRGFVVTATDAKGAIAARDVLSGLFITAPDDPRGAVAACPGAPACASGSTPTLTDAARLAEAFRPFSARGLRAHVSGCAKGCAHPGPADLTLVGRDGGYDIVLAGRPDGEPAMRLTFEAALERVRRADPALSLPLAHVFRTMP